MRPAGVYGKVEGLVCPIPTNFDLQHPIQQRHQNFYVLAKLRVELVAKGIVVVEGALRALGGGREVREFHVQNTKSFLIKTLIRVQVLNVLQP